MDIELEQKLYEFIIANFNHFEQLILPYKNKREELLKTERLFEDEINTQYNEHIKAIICNEITKQTGCSYEDAIILFEENELENQFI